MNKERDAAKAPELAPTFARRVFAWGKELGLIVAAALILSLVIKTFFFQSFWIPSGSMEHTLDVGDRVLVTKWRPGPLELRRGDIIVFKDPGGWLPGAASGSTGPLQAVLTFTGLLPADAGEHVVKRVIGLPGDVVECCDAQGRILVNGVPLDEELYLNPGIEPSNKGFVTTVPEGYVWVMGDNRPGSADSRAHTYLPGGGSIPQANIVGVVFATVWPLDRWRGHGNPLEESGQNNDVNAAGRESDDDSAFAPESE